MFSFIPSKRNLGLEKIIRIYAELPCNGIFSVYFPPSI